MSKQLPSTKIESLRRHQLKHFSATQNMDETWQISFAISEQQMIDLNANRVIIRFVTFCRPENDA